MPARACASRSAAIGRRGQAHGEVAGEHALQAAGGFFGAVGDDHLTSVLAVADADAAAVVEAHPG
jgi:hypothetical protein